MNENHFRAVRSSLLFVEKRLTELRDRVTNEGDKHKLYRYVDDLDQASRDWALDTIRQILSEVDYAAETLGIEPTELSLRREVESVLSGVWVVVESLKPERMKGYGVLDETDCETMSDIYERIQKTMPSCG